MKLMFLLIALLIIPVCLFLYTWIRLHNVLNLHAVEDKSSVSFGTGAKTEFVTNKDGQGIAYWYFKVSNPKAVVILIHGYNNPGGKVHMLGHAKYLFEAGYSTVLLDLRAFGESGGNKISLGVNEWKDVSAVYDVISKLPENKNIKIGLFGVSMGAVTAINTAGMTGKGDFIIASVPYADFRSMFNSQIKYAGLPPLIFYPFMRLSALIEMGSDYEKITPKEFISKIEVPIFLIEGKQDVELNAQDTKYLFDKANEPKELWIADCGHDVFARFPEEFKQKVLVFLQKYANR